MEQKELILKAVDYVNDFPARVEEFLKKEGLIEKVNSEKKKLPKTKADLSSLIAKYQLSGNPSIKMFLEDYED